MDARIHKSLISNRPEKIDLLRDEYHGDAEGAGNNKESHEKYFVKPEGNKFRTVGKSFDADC
jgi:hypothetical protein